MKRYINSSVTKGHYVTNITLVLSAVRPFESEAEGPQYNSRTVPAMNLTGVWAESDGGLVKVESDGTTFIAIEYPHARKWGTVAGVLSGDTIRGVDFRSAASPITDIASPIHSTPWEDPSRPLYEDSVNRENGLMSLSHSTVYSPSLWTSGVETFVLSYVVCCTASSMRLGIALSLTIYHKRARTIYVNQLPHTYAQVSTGVVVSGDKFFTSASEAVIIWTGGQQKSEWSRLTDYTSTGYRFLKIEVSAL